MNESTKKVFYAAVGAPIVTVKRVNARVGEMRGQVGERAEKIASRVGADARKRYDLWADEGQKFVTQMGEQPVVEDITGRVDLDQIQGQVNRIREQLDEMVAAWRDSFRPEGQKETVPVEEKPNDKPAAKTATKQAASKKPPAKKPAAKKPAAKKPATKKPTTGNGDSAA